jgi:hypothetical protein
MTRNPRAKASRKSGPEVSAKICSPADLLKIGMLKLSALASFKSI